MASLASSQSSTTDPAAAGVEPLPAGTQVGRYEIRTALARGASGIVYAGVSAQLGRPVTLKEFVPASAAVRAGGQVVPASAKTRAAFADGLRAFSQEARYQAQIDHPHVQRVIDLVEALGTAFLVYDGTATESLQARLDRQPTPWLAADAFALLRAMLDALEAVHGYGLVHGDVKPGNILLTSSGRALLTDFGATFNAAEGPPAEVAVTPGYAAPERVSIGGRSGPWSDLYSLGAVLHALAFGSPPGPNGRTAGPLPSEWPRPFAESILRALQPQPADRFPAAVAWRETLEITSVMRVKARSSRAGTRTIPEAQSDDTKPPADRAASVGPARSVRDEVPATIKLDRRTGAVPPLPPLPPVRRAGAVAKHSAPIPVAPPLPTSDGLAKDRRRHGVRSSIGRIGSAAAVVALAGVSAMYLYPRYADWARDVWIVAPDGSGHAVTISDALSRARSAVAIHIQPGRYEENIRLDQPMTLLGIVDDQGTLPVIAPASGPAISVLASAEAVSLQDLRVDGSASADAPCLDLQGAATTAQGLALSNCGIAGIAVQSGAGAALDGLTIETPSGPGIRVQEGGTVHLAESTIVGAAMSGLVVRTGAEATIANTTIEYPGQAGILVLGRAEIANVTITRSGTSGLEIRQGGSAQVSGGAIRDGRGAGLYVRDGGQGAIDGLEISGNRLSGVIVGPDGRPVLSALTIAGNGEHGIYLMDGAAGRVSDTMITENRGYGVSMAEGATTEMARLAATGNKPPDYVGVDPAEIAGEPQRTAGPLADTQATGGDISGPSRGSAQ